MAHPIYRVLLFEIVGPYTLSIGFDDGSQQTINLLPVLAGDVLSPLRDIDVFNQVKLDPEIQNLVWPNGADFDPATLHDWPRHKEAMARLAQQWSANRARSHSGYPA